MKKTKRAMAFITALVLMLSLFSITTGAVTDNFASFEVTPVRDKDFSSDISAAPMLNIKASRDVQKGAIFTVSLSPTAKWTYDDVADFSQFFTKTGGSYVSKASLTNDAGFQYTASVITSNEIQIVTNEDLPEGASMYLPLIVKLDGISEASVTVSNGEPYGVNSGTYVFANRGKVNEFRLDLSASSTAEKSIITGSVVVGMSAGLGSAGIELTLPTGFVFEETGKSKVTLTGEGSYKQARLSDIYLNNSNTTMYIKFDSAEKSTSQGKLIFEKIRIKALENAPEGEIALLFNMPAYDIKNEKVILGNYKAEKVEEQTQKPAQKPVEEQKQVRVTATAGDKTILINGEPFGLDVAPFNDEAGRMMVPLRFIVNAFGMGEDAVKWEPANKEVTIVFADANSKKEILFAIGSSLYFVDGTQKTMDTAAVIKEGYTFIPVRYAAEALGLKINYIEETKTAEFSSL